VKNFDLKKFFEENILTKKNLVEENLGKKIVQKVLIKKSFK